MHRSTPIVLAVVVAALAASSSASAAPALRGSTVADDVATLRGWSVSGRPARRAIGVESGHTYAFDGRALRLGPGGSIARALPRRPWSLSFDVRMPVGAKLRVDLGGRPLELTQREAGLLLVGPEEEANLLATGGRWHHVEIAGFDPVEVHVEGTRVPNRIAPASRIRFRVLRGHADLTGLVATRRDDRRAALLHRLANYRANTPRGRFPIGTGSAGRIRFGTGPYDGAFAGSLWRAHALTGGRLFRDWGERATWDHMGREPGRSRTYVQWQGLRYLESSGLAELATCTPPRGHRCRVIRKSTGGTAGSLLGMTLGNPGTSALPTVLWPNRCATCASPDEVEIRIDSMMDVGIFEHAARLADRPRDAERYATATRRHAEAVARLLVAEDGSTREAVRTNRLDGTVLGYPSTHTPEGGVWARGQASAIYGFARAGLALREPSLVAVADRAARYLESRLGAGREVPYDLAPPEPEKTSGDGVPQPPDRAAGALAAAGLLRLADACERVTGACADAARWRALGDAILHRLLSSVSTHLPAGVLGDQHAGPDDPVAEYLLGIDFALEAIARSAG